MEGGEVVAAEDSDTLLGFVLLNEVRASLYSVLELSYGSVPWWVKLLPTSAGGTLLLGGKIRQGTSKQMAGRSMAKMSSSAGMASVSRRYQRQRKRRRICRMVFVKALRRRSRMATFGFWHLCLGITSYVIRNDHEGAVRIMSEKGTNLEH